MEFRILGSLEVIADGRERAIRGAKLRTVLGLLLVHANQTVSNDALIDAVWGDAPPPSASGTLQTYVYQLRKALGPDTIATRPNGYALDVSGDDIDAYRFEHAAAVRSEPPEAVAARLTEALGWWRGAALAQTSTAPNGRGPTRHASSCSASTPSNVSSTHDWRWVSTRPSSRSSSG